MAKIDELLHKTHMLEQSVLYDDITKLQEVWDSFKPFELSARALAYACVFGSMEKVRFLTDAKYLVPDRAEFAYKETSRLQNKYDLTYADKTRTLSSSFNLLIAWNWNLEEHITDKFWKLHFGNLPKPDLQPLSEKDRVDICRYLVSYCPDDFQPDQVLYYAILWQQWKIVKALQDAGVVLREAIPNRWGWPSEYQQVTDEYLALTRSSPTVARRELITMLHSMREENCLRVLECFSSEIARIHPNEKMAFSVNDLAESQTVLTSVRVFQFLLDHTETSSWNKQKVMEILIEKNELGTLQEALSRGWLRGASALEKLLDYAYCAQRPEVVALLLEHTKVK